MVTIEEYMEWMRTLPRASAEVIPTKLSFRNSPVPKVTVRNVRLDDCTEKARA